MTPSNDFHRCLVAFALILFTSGCATTPVPPVVEQPDDTMPFASDGGEATYHLLLAELALERNQYDVAAVEYQKAAELSDDVEVAQRAATLSFSLGRYEEAIGSARRWRMLDPESQEAHRYLASLYLRRSEIDNAVPVLNAMLGLYGDLPEEAFLAVTSILLEEPDLPTATRAMNRLVSKHPDIGAAHYGLALMSLQGGDRETAQRHVTTALELRPDWPRAALLQARVLVAKGETDKGLELAAELARNATDPSIRLDYALMLATLDREGQARLELDLLLDEYPRMAGALRAAGLLEMRRGDLNAAQLHFTSLLATGRGTWEAFFYLGTIAEERSQNGRAIRYYSQVHDGDLAITAQARVASLYESMGELDRAIEHLTEFARENPKLDAELYTAAAEILSRNDQFDRAMLMLDDVLTRHPGNRPARFARAFLYEKMDQVDISIDELRALLKEAPDDANALNALGYTLVDRTGRYREGYKLIRKAYDIDPDNPAIIDSMGWAEYRRGNLAEAETYLMRAYSQIRDPEIAAHLGEVLWVQGKTDAAMAIWLESLEQNPNAQVLIEVMQRFGQ